MPEEVDWTQEAIALLTSKAKFTKSELEMAYGWWRFDKNHGVIHKSLGTREQLLDSGMLGYSTDRDLEGYWLHPDLMEEITMILQIEGFYLTLFNQIKLYQKPGSSIFAFYSGQ